MRTNLLKSSSTKAERRFAEILKRNHISFRHRQIVDGREIDFIIGDYAIEIDGHDQDARKNDWLVKLGYIPMHFTNRALKDHPEAVEEVLIKKLCR